MLQLQQGQELSRTLTRGNPVSQQYFNPFEPSQGFLAPLVKTNQLAVANLEKLANLQMKILQSYVDLGLACLKAAAQVHDSASQQAFYTSQFEAAANLPQKWIDDTQAFSTLGAEFQDECSAQAKATVEEWTDEAKEASKEIA